ncbi:antibiotic biosynthesis monooxygenase domain-containing protein [Halalkalibacter wakoensis JCM 9140]|uniref:Antibiotic biosynthesis monooxygenase domain-containing protein n=1 Tax=Halalkalibacter wakoensis JCM 9140 TaxID=1236970 RepID=W4Q784_9BACI|nr:antibiotic biosynthesis monooxygenase [Halalkalibacter wakoensis]GAE27825.1 antibiotic biosynthesis monooxygenase domain-containing protein [Halalkalibacter wakoensis JCM 9140]
MFIQMRKIEVTEGNSDKVVERFSKPGIIEEQEGFIDSTVMVKKVRRGNEEVIVQIRWESEAHWKQWEKSDAHIAGHKANLGKPKPEHIVQIEGGVYHVQAVKTAKKAETK